MRPSELAGVADALAEARAAGALFQTAGESGHAGRYVNVAGESLLNFASYDYLGLSRRDELKEGAVEATRRHGPQFPFPRAMLQSHLYVELQELLERMTGGHVVVAASTTLAHLAAIPVVVEPDDAVVVDSSAHPSLHAALKLLTGVPIHEIPADRLDALEHELTQTFASNRRVWYVLDGLDPLTGSLAPLDELAALMRRHAALHLYVDDAHATSWTGASGRGHALERIPDRDRMVVSLSLNKAFSASGGAVIVSDPTLALRVQQGRGLAFSGAIPPPMLGAAVASAKLHLSPVLPVLQQKLTQTIRRVVSRARERGVPLESTAETPLFFVPCGSTEKTLALTRALREHGLYAAGIVFPLVPAERSGIRFMVSAFHEEEDVDRLLSALGESVGRSTS